jgi:hypothetical protein
LLPLEEVRPSQGPVSPASAEQFNVCTPNNHGEIPETDSRNASEPVENRLVVGASGNELLLEVQVEGETHQFLIDSGASLSLVKPGVSQAEVRPTELATRGITGTKLKSIGTHKIEIKLGNS